MADTIPYNSGARLFFDLLANEFVRHRTVLEPFEIVVPRTTAWVDEDIRLLANALAIRNGTPDTVPNWLSTSDDLKMLAPDAAAVLDLRGQGSSKLPDLSKTVSVPPNLVVLTQCGNPVSSFRKIDLSPQQGSLLEMLMSSFKVFGDKLGRTFDLMSVAAIFRQSGFRKTMAHFDVFPETACLSLLEPAALMNFCRDMCSFWSYQDRQVDHQVLLHWIGQFSSDEAKIGACNILEYMHKQGFLSRYEIMKSLRHEIDALRAHNKSAKIVSIQNPGKSEGMLHYELRNEKGRIRQLSDAIKDTGTKTLILIDDVIGSGKTFLDCMFENKGTLDKNVMENWLKQEGNALHIIVAIASDDGKEAIETDPRCHASVTVRSGNTGEVGRDVFADNADIFESATVRESFKVECRKLGKNLFAPHPLGWRGCAWAVATSYNVPNCSLPVIWSSETSISWSALLERR
ncbi:phosphoribosyltransferase-like protein [Ruegeria sp.]|uniref:phosphoribosyltransferase-like protein n=1 Tax=Ruegeria sp. TaxID=1879320 RepID=UPI003B5BD777